jgi:hypothetical protein
MATPAISVGKKLSHFRLVEKIGGGQGVVFRAHDERFDKRRLYLICNRGAVEYIFLLLLTNVGPKILRSYRVRRLPCFIRTLTTEATETGLHQLLETIQKAIPMEILGSPTGTTCKCMLCPRMAWASMIRKPEAPRYS